MRAYCAGLNNPFCAAYRFNIPLYKDTCQLFFWENAEVPQGYPLYRPALASSSLQRLFKTYSNIFTYTEIMLDFYPIHQPPTRPFLQHFPSYRINELYAAQSPISHCLLTLTKPQFQHFPSYRENVGIIPYSSTTDPAFSPTFPVILNKCWNFALLKALFPLVCLC